MRSVKLKYKQWVQVSDDKCSYQNRAKHEVLMSTSVDEPVSTEEAFTFKAGEFGSFESSNSSKLWAYSDVLSNGYISVEDE